MHQIFLASVTEISCLLLLYGSFNVVVIPSLGFGDIGQDFEMIGITKVKTYRVNGYQSVMSAAERFLSTVHTKCP
jgi:hypothetical protein